MPDEIQTEIQAVILDLDGTLLDTEALYRAAFFATLSDLGHSLPEARYAELVGLAAPERRALLPTLFGRAFPLDAFLAVYRDRRTALLAGGIPLKRGAGALLDWLETEGMPKAIATAASAATAHGHLAATGLTPRFAAVVTRDDVARSKPAPDPFLRAAAVLGVAPAACLAVEDSPVGIAAALAAGMVTVLVPDVAPPSPALAASCAGVLDDLGAVAAFVAARRAGPSFSDVTRARVASS